MGRVVGFVSGTVFTVLPSGLFRTGVGWGRAAYGRGIACVMLAGGGFGAGDGGRDDD
ncbi:hypothetical protein GCM10017771_62620 [Streptomyces capitiformicae]|uniref:Uncharacterized protein n=1 Tax=Streptomyces capitiformicae TaxID=2014920 RepID=A0A919DGR0_9ACTN|nr:hypothetical protein GCM10017771_62620 [Streptomyces capitiformicae]